jgi:hypothetical protein
MFFILTTRGNPWNPAYKVLVSARVLYAGAD